MPEFVSDEMRATGVWALRLYSREKNLRVIVERIYLAMCEARDRGTRNSDLPPWEEFNKR